MPLLSSSIWRPGENLLTLTAGTRLGRYEIRSQLGVGGMGEVYLARDEKINRDVAIKVLPADFSADIDRLRRFEREAQAAGALNHPNILVVYDVGTHEYAPYVVSELLEGETLRERMNGKSLPQRKAIDYALQIAQGLEAAHEKGIIHRDLKPENLFITKDGRVKILDFGLAKLLAPDDRSQSQTEVPTRVNTESGIVVGTVGYMSPEQLRNKHIDHRSDIFSFGAILYEMLAGRSAFRGESTADTTSAILHEDPPDLSETNKNIVPALQRVVNHCLEKNPEERFHSAGDLAFAIEALSGMAGVSSSAATVLTAMPYARKKRRDLLPWIAAGALLITSLVMTMLYIRRSRPDERPVRFVVSMPERATEVLNPIISPDGRAMAFLASFEGKPFLYIRPLDSLTARQLAGTEDAGFPFWSPDSRSLGFFSNKKLKTIDLAGGPAHTLCDVPTATGGSWSRDGVILVGMDNKGIQRVSAVGGVPTPVTKLDESQNEQSHWWPSFLPDGRHFLYSSWSGSSDQAAVYVGSLDGSAPRMLLKNDSNAAYAPPGYLLFGRGETVMAQPFDVARLQLSGEPFPVAERVMFITYLSLSNFSVSETGTLIFWTRSTSSRQLVWFDRTGKRLGVAGSPGEYNDIALSPDEKRAALQRIDSGSSDIWLIDLARGLLSRFTFDKAVEDNPVWSPDGRMVVFASGREGHPDIYRKVASGAGNEELLVKSDVAKEPTDWSRDGRFVIFNTSDPKTGGDLWVLPLFGDGKPYPLLQTRFDEEQGYLSADGRWFAYMSNESGRNNVYVQSFPPSGGKWQISTAGGAQPRWGRDGKELFYMAPDRKLMAVEVRAGETFEMSEPKQLFQTHVIRYDAPNRFSISADGQRFLVNSAVEEVNQTPITVVLNWTAGRKK